MKNLLTSLQAAKTQTTLNFSHHVMRSGRFVTTAVIMLFTSTVVHGDGVKDAVKRVENKVNKIQNKVNTIGNSTNGLEELVVNVQDITDTFYNPELDLFEEVKESLGLATELITFIKENRPKFEPSDEDADISELLYYLVEIANTLADESDLFDFDTLYEFIDKMENGPVLDPIKFGLRKVGIDQDFVDKSETTLRDLIDLVNAIKEYRDENTGCPCIEEKREVLGGAASAVGAYGKYLKLGGGIMGGMAKTVATGKKFDAGIHGYASFEIETDVREAIGRIMTNIAEALIEKADNVHSMLDHCEIVNGQQEILANQRLILNRLPTP